MFFAFAKAYSMIQDYKQHVVESGETVYSIAQKYDIAAEELLQLNPDLKTGLKTGATLILPANAALLTQARVITYKDHKASRKETLYAIAKQYGITVLDIKEANKELYSRELKKGDKLKIPVFEEAINSSSSSAGATGALTAGTYEVQPKDTKYGIAKKFEITVATLDELNPGIENIQPGMVLKISAKNTALANTQKPATTGNYMEYVVPAQMTMYTLEGITGMTEDAILALNPALKDGLKAGMTLKLPNAAFKAAKANEPTTTEIKSFQGKRIALLLPFSLQQIDTVATDLNRLKKDFAMRVATDFYSGAVVARDSAIAMGIPVRFDVYDSQKTVGHIDSLLVANDFTKYDMIIGPLLSKTIDQLASKMPDKTIPIISPISNSDISAYPNVFQARPQEKLLKQKLFSYLKGYASGKHVIIIADNKNPSLKNEFKAAFPGATVVTPNTSNYIYKKDFVAALTTSGENVVIIAAKDDNLVDDTVVSLGSKANEFNIRIFAYENFDNLFLPITDLAATGFTFPSMNYYQGSNNAFYKRYNDRYGKNPNEVAVRGFDVTMDAILRLNEKDGMYKSVETQKESMMVENPFNYVPNKDGKGYDNNAFFLLQYTRSQTLKRIDNDSDRKLPGKSKM